MCEVRVIQTLQQVYCFDKKASLHRKEGKKQKKQKKTHKLLLRSSVKLDKARYTAQTFVTLRTTISERLLEQQQKEHTG